MLGDLMRKTGTGPRPATGDGIVLAGFGAARNAPICAACPDPGETADLPFRSPVRDASPGEPPAQ
jgi:hypothetical protein